MLSPALSADAAFGSRHIENALPEALDGGVSGIIPRPALLGEQGSREWGHSGSVLHAVPASPFSTSTAR